MTPSGPSLDPSVIGLTAGPVVHDVDARWIMAYAAGLGETDPRWYDTTTPDGPPAHPLFPVSYEWPALLDLRGRFVDATLAPRAVHAAHRLLVTRPPRAGDRLATTARVSALLARPAGALLVTTLDTVDAAGQPVTTTTYASLFRGVHATASLDPGGVVRADVPVVSGGRRWEETVEVPAGAAHVYTECARIWNPIHTDLAVARAAGLPGIILHGTASLALAVSRLLRHDLGGDPRRLREVSARFTGMVPMPTVLAVRGLDAGDDTLGFEVIDAAGRTVVGAGRVRALSH